MTSWNPRANALFLKARELQSPEERRSFLDEACAGDVVVRSEVESLLDASLRAGSFLESPASGPMRPSHEERDSSPAERPGTIIGPYKLLEQIGEGGFGIVFMAEQHQPLRRKLALKVVKPGMDTRQVIARFEAERQALALMDHPNIARVFDGGATESGRPYFVMELVRGIPITDFCDQNHLPIRARLELFVSICQAVHHAHQKGVIHRDLKPSNVMVTMHDAVPVVKVIDFGIAKAMGQQLTEKTLFTNFAQMIGTPVYMSPEQAQMSGLDVDTRTDIYSLGVLLYELVTGTTPFDQERLGTAAYDEMRRIIIEEEPATPSTRISRLGRSGATVSANRHCDPKRLMQSVRGELDWIVMKALEKDRNRRYESASTFAADVQRYLRDQVVLACPPTFGYRLGKIVRRHKGPVLAVLLVAVSLVGGIVGTAWGLIRAEHAKAAAVAEAAQKNVALEHKEIALGAARQSERAKTDQLWHALVAQARGNRLSRRSGQRFESLKTLEQAAHLARTLDSPAERFHELRNAVIATLALPDLYLAEPLNAWPTGALNVDFDEAHTTYARTDRQGNCSIRRVADDVELHYLPGLGGLATPRLSPDGKVIAIVHYDIDPAAYVATHVWQLDSSTPRQILSEAQAGMPDFRGSQQIVLPYADGSIRQFDLPSGRLLSRLAPDTLTRELRAALHPTAPMIATCSYFTPVVQVRDVQTGNVLASLPQTARVTSVAWHPSGHTLAIGYAESCQIRLCDWTTWQPYRTLGTGQAVTHLAFNHAGDRLAITGWAGTVELFDVGSGRKLFSTPTGGMCRFGPDDRRLAGGIQDGRIGIWQVADGREFRTLGRALLGPLDEYIGATVSADGRMLAVAATDGFGLWDLTSGSELAFIPSRSAENRVLFEPSGSLLTLSNVGVSRWPLVRKTEGGGKCVIGPPERLPLPLGHDLTQSRDGRVIVTCDRAVARQEPYAGGWILHAESPDKPIRLDAGADIALIAVSPDGRWVVTTTHHGASSKIWEARDGRLVKKLADWGTGRPQFSPDGRWLATNLDGGRLVEVETWEMGPRVGVNAVFAPDGKLIAVPTAAGIRLVDIATGREIASLEDPSLNNLRQSLFSPDGTKLIAVTATNGVHIWDLRLIRQHLQALALDWDWPEFPPEVRLPHAECEGHEKLEVSFGDSDPSVLTREEKARQAIEHYRRTIESDPESAVACNNLAWAYVTAPESLRDVDAALPLAEKAVRLAATPRDLAVFRNTLGVAYYRAGRYRDAVRILRPNLTAQEDWGLAFDLYFLAMSHHQLGETERARDYYDWAVRWIATQANLQAGHIEELTIFHAEAEEMLGLKTESAAGRTLETSGR